MPDPILSSPILSGPILAGPTPPNTGAAAKPSAPSAAAPKTAPATRAPDPGAVTIKIGAGQSLDDALRAGLNAIYGAFYKGDASRLKAVVDTAIASLRPALAATAGASALQFRIASVATTYGGDPVGAAGGASALAVEAAAVINGRIAPSNTAVADLDGASLGLGTDAIAAGQTSARYARAQTLTGPGVLDGADLKTLRAAQSAMTDTLKVMDMLSAYRKGDMAPLNALIATTRALGKS